MQSISYPSGDQCAVPIVEVQQLPEPVIVKRFSVVDPAVVFARIVVVRSIVLDGPFSPVLVYIYTYEISAREYIVPTRTGAEGPVVAELFSFVFVLVFILIFFFLLVAAVSLFLLVLRFVGALVIL